MKKVFFVGKSTALVEKTGEYEENQISIQICSDNAVMVKGMLKLNKPDLVLIDMNDMKETNKSIFIELRDKYPQTPVVCVGKQWEFDMFPALLKEEQFLLLPRPVEDHEVFKAVYELIYLKNEEEAFMSDSGRKCILLIDDSAIQLRALNNMLKDKYDIMMATSGVRGLTLIGKRVPDIIFLDYEMPVCDGKMTMQMIREIDEAKTVPIIFLTGMKDKKHIESALELLPDGYLLKPASTKLIYEVLDKYL